MRVLVGGGTGFIGRALVEALKRKGHEVTIISRTQAPGKITWSEISKSPLPECEAVVNLAGENILNPLKRWNEGFLQKLRDSRIETTKTLARKISEASNPPKVFVSSSAVVGNYQPITFSTPISRCTLELGRDGESVVCLVEDKLARRPS